MTPNTVTGGKDEVLTSYSENIRITKANTSKIIINTDIGEQLEDNGLVLLGSYDSNMEKTSNIEDSFIYEGYKYIITSVMKNKEKNSITSIQAKAKIIK